MRLIYLSPVSWSSFSQRPHKFVEWFQKKTKGEVLWIEPYPTRLPKISDIERLESSVSKGVVINPKWITLLKPKYFPIEPIQVLDWLNLMLWDQLTHKIDQFLSEEECLFVFGKPSKLALLILSKYKNYPSIYDAMDDFPEFYDGISKKSMERVENELLSKIDVVWSSSKYLKEKMAKKHPKVKVVNNAFDESNIFLHKPKSKSKKTFGYVGTIANWFDWEWMIEFAKSCPNDNVHIHGPLCIKIPYSLPKNIRLFDKCSHFEALKKMSKFEVGLIPFRVNKLTESVDPIKYYEYRAIGIPVISTNFGEMRLRKKESGVFISEGISDIQKTIQAAIKYKQNERTRKIFLSKNSWRYRFDSTNLLSEK